MKLQNMFQKDINRDINGVIKVARTMKAASNTNLVNT